jgi:hypothetical protein
MRARMVGLTLVGLGALAVAGAVSARSALPLAAGALPLDAEFSTTALGDQVTFVDPVALAERTSGDTSVTVRVRGDAETGDAGDDIAVWEFLSTVDDADGTLVGTTTTVACLDRRTAEAVDCVSEAVDGERVDVRGLTVRFPFDTARRDYDVWDTTVRQAFPARFAGAETLRGLEVYRFEQEVPAQVIGSVSVPGPLLGSPAGTVAAEVLHSSDRTLLVEPVTGVVVSSQESPETRLRGPDGAAGAVLLSGTFATSDESLEDALALVADVRGERERLRDVVPWAAGGTGALLLAAGGLLVARGRGARTEIAEDEPVRTPVPAA